MALPDSTQLRNDFNDRSGLRRVVSVVSPTCDDCLAGLTLVLETIDGTADMVGLVLWVCMLARDAPEVAEATAKRFVARPRVLHYWEEEGWPVSTRLRPVLGRGPYDPTRSAWDVYLLYGRGIQWGDGNPPVPTAWAYNTRDDLPSGARLSTALIRDWMHD